MPPPIPMAELRRKSGVRLTFTTTTTSSTVNHRKIHTLQIYCLVMKNLPALHLVHQNLTTKFVLHHLRMTSVFRTDNSIFLHYH